MAASADPDPARIRPHVHQAVRRARHVLLDFDGVMFNVKDSLGPDTREQAVTALLANRDYRPRPILVTFAWFGVHRTLAYLAEREPDHAAEAESVVSALELDAALTAQPTLGIGLLLEACAVTGRRIAVISDIAEPAVLAALRGNGMYRYIAAVAARQGLDLAAIDAACTIHRAADLLSVLPGVLDGDVAVVGGEDGRAVKRPAGGRRAGRWSPW